MTIQDAIRSGKSFKRPQEMLWLMRDIITIKYEKYPNMGTVNLFCDDILAEDWEIKP